MSETTEIKKGKGIDGVIRDITPGRVEDERELVVVGGVDFSQLMENYRKFLGDEGHDEFSKKFKPAGVKIVLTPLQVNSFLQSTVIYEDHERYNNITGLFISSCILKSYNAGNTKFMLDTRNLPEINNIGNLLRAEKGRRITIDVFGDVGIFLGIDSAYVTYSVHGNVAVFGAYNAHYQRYTVYGDVDERFGLEAVFSSFDLKGETGSNSFSKAAHSRITVYKNVKNDFGRESSDCVYRTPDKSVLQRLLAVVPERNDVVFIDENGRQQMVRKRVKR